jgi:hypothetical protein
VTLDASIIPGSTQGSQIRLPDCPPPPPGPLEPPSASRDENPHPRTGVLIPLVVNSVQESEFLSDALVLYKGALLARLNRAKVSTGWACRFVLSNPPADFSRDARPLYLTEEREIARKYCEFAWSRVQRQLDLGIMEIEVDRQWLQENTTYIHGVWKEYVHIYGAWPRCRCLWTISTVTMCLAVPFVPLAM